MFRQVGEAEGSRTLSEKKGGSIWGTRWEALGRRLLYFGQSKLMHHLPVSRDAAVRILEVGCHEGHLLLQFAAYFANAHLVGVAYSKRIAAYAQQKAETYRNRIDVYPSEYGATDFPIKASFDVLLFSYQLSQSKQTWEAQLEQAYHDLKPGGLIAVVDFHSTALRGLQHRLQQKHRHGFNPQMLVHLQQQFRPLSVDVCSAYAGLWKYFFFVGMKPQY